MTHINDDPGNPGLALDTFLAEGRGCWRVYKERMETEEDGHTVRLDCLGCGVRIWFLKSAM